MGKSNLLRKFFILMWKSVLGKVFTVVVLYINTMKTTLYLKFYQTFMLTTYYFLWKQCRNTGSTSTHTFTGLLGDRFIHLSYSNRENFLFKGSVWLDMLIELRVQFCRYIFQKSFETYKTFVRSKTKSSKSIFKIFLAVPKKMCHVCGHGMWAGLWACMQAGMRLKTMSSQTIPLKLKYSFYLQKYC